MGDIIKPEERVGDITLSERGGYDSAEGEREMKD